MIKVEISDNVVQYLKEAHNFGLDTDLSLLIIKKPPEILLSRGFGLVEHLIFIQQNLLYF